tara:strand:- start:368 stop:811 length:444 start_codon:yes stop_codon:yes gene_type:complete
MKRNLRSFHPDDLNEIVPKPFQHLEHMCLMKQDWSQYWSIGGLGFSGVNCSRILFCGGCFPVWSGRATAWFILDQNFDRFDLLWMVKRVRSFLENSMPDTVRRIDATAREDFPPASRMLEMLGFESEGLMKKYGPDGASHYIYARMM